MTISRVAYSEILDDERKETAAGFWERANAFFASIGVTVTAVMTDNGACYRSHAFADALGQIRHKWTRPYRPQTNGKVERFNRTLATEWAYASAYNSEQARTDAYTTWLHHYNHHRTPHRHQRQNPRKPRSQPHREVQLVDAGACQSRVDTGAGQPCARRAPRPCEGRTRLPTRMPCGSLCLRSR